MTRDMSNAQIAELYSSDNKDFPMLIRYQSGKEATVKSPQEITFGASFVILATGLMFNELPDNIKVWQDVRDSI